MKLVVAGIFLAIVVVVLGAFTRLVDAGLGCPDWPGCYGHLLWPNESEEIARAEAAYPDAPVDLDKTWPEMVHRYFAGSLLLLVLVVTVVSFRDAEHRSVKPLAASLLVLIICQAAFGAWTVTLKLWPQVVTAHLLGGFATLSLLWVIYLRLVAPPRLALTRQQRAQIGWRAPLALAVVILQIALGGWVTSNYAALACADFPTCFGAYWPEMDLTAGFNVLQAVGPNYLGGVLESEARVAIHWMHRLGALLTLLVVGILGWHLIRQNRLLGGMLLLILLAQIMLGILNVVWSLPLAVATLHNLCGALLLLAVVTVNFAPPKS